MWRFSGDAEEAPRNAEVAGVLEEHAFLKVLLIEQKRAERSRRRFVLMLMECANLTKSGLPAATVRGVLDELGRAIRVTDTVGWYKSGAVLGVIFTELGGAEGKLVLQALLGKVSQVLAARLSIEQVNQIRICFQVYPKEWSDEGDSSDTGLFVHTGVDKEGTPGKTSFKFKRLVDIAGSLTAMALLAPVFAAIAVGVKLTSPGPVFFRQRRIGQYGKPFTFWKFRSMKVNNDASAHEKFVKEMIVTGSGGGKNGVFKITDDPRVTKLGKFLRKSSLDELPQFYNVLKGEMSLVGPRPPVPYEVKVYDYWHRRRLLAVKPGITGLWQVNGRSRVGFDDMVRMDLQYASNWSMWLDMKIMLQTPMAVLGGSGAC
jgi:lipopolysaccharide/colanic/teichoic acid biosynthesis glycosyltransferase